MNRIMEIWERIPKFLRNKYAYASFAFLIWIAFFDQHNLISQYELRSEMHELEDSKEWYEVQILQTQEDLNELLTDDEKLEKFAREKYLMKKSDEDIFVIVQK